MERPKLWEILEASYDGFLARYIEDARDAGYTFEETCAEWIDCFGLDSQDPLVDYAFEHYFGWAGEPTD